MPLPNYLGAGKGGASPVAALSDVSLTNLQDGDLLAWDAGTSKFVSSGNLRIGGAVEIFGIALPTTAIALSLDPDGAHTSEYFRAGLTLNVAKDGWIVPVAGRYHVWGFASVLPDSTVDAVIQIGSSVEGHIGLDGLAYLDHRTTSFGEQVQFSTLAELAVGFVIQFSAYVPSAAPPSLSLGDSYFFVQYIGPAVSL